MKASSTDIAVQLNERAAELEQTNRYMGGTATLMRQAAEEIKRLREFEWMYKDLCK